jgi:hypothetical protein
MMNAIRTPKVDIDLKKRLCFYLRNDNIHWPAVYYTCFEEYLNQFQDEMDHDLKCRVAFDYMEAVKNNKHKMKIFRPLGKSIADYVQIEEGKDEYFDFFSGMCHVLNNEVTNPKVFSSNEEYLEFMKGLDESEKLGQGSEKPPSERTWRQHGLENLAKMDESTLDSADASQDQEMADPPAQDPSSEKESAFTEEQEIGDQVMLDFSSAPKEATASASEAPAPQEPQALTDDQPESPAIATTTTINATEETPAASSGDGTPRTHNQSSSATVVSTDTSSTCAETAKTAESPAIAATTTINATEETSAASSSDGTPRTHNQSSSATVVSTDTSSTCAESASTSEATLTFPVPAVDESMDADQIGWQVVMVGWGSKQNEDGELLYLFPGIDIDTGVRETNCFSLDELMAFVKEHNFFKKTVRKLFSPITSVGKKSPAPIKKKTTAKTSPFKSLALTTSGRTRFSPRGTRSRNVKERIVPSDPFYRFHYLIQVLTNHFGWDYVSGGGLANWQYVRGDSKPGKNGIYGIDYFREEREVEDFCMEHNYKEKFETLQKLQKEEDEKVEILQKEEDKKFVTPQRVH